MLTYRSWFLTYRGWFLTYQDWFLTYHFHKKIGKNFILNYWSINTVYVVKKGESVKNDFIIEESSINPSFLQ